MPLGTQGKILRVLTEQQFTRAGGTDKVRVDLRVISSTCRDLRTEIGRRLEQAPGKYPVPAWYSARD